MNKETLSKMNQLKLYGMHYAFKTIVEENRHQELSSDQLIEQLVDAEYDDRHNRKITRLLRNAKLRHKAAVEDIVYDDHRQLDKDMVLRLAEGIYLEKTENILITGSTGVGKSFIACALAYQACNTGHKALYYNTSRLLSQLKLSKADGTYVRNMLKIQRHDLLILDDFGLQPIDPINSNILLELVEDRYDIGSLIITSQIPVEGWYELITEKTFADAIMDRIVHKAHTIELVGESMRKKRKK